MWKKLSLFLGMLILTVGMVFAGSVNYDSGDTGNYGKCYSDYCSEHGNEADDGENFCWLAQCEDLPNHKCNYENDCNVHINNATVDADTLEGRSYGDISNKIDEKTQFDDSYMDEEQLSSLLYDGRTLFDQYSHYTEYADTQYVPVSKYEELQSRVDRLQATVNILLDELGGVDEQKLNCNTQLMKAKRSGENVRYNDGWVASTSGFCFKAD